MNLITAFSIFFIAFSYHSFPGMNEANNPAYGVLVNDRFGHIHFTNSFYKETDVLFCKEPLGENIDLWIGMVHGYTDNWILVPLPMVSIGFRGFKLYGMCIPQDNGFTCAGIFQKEIF